MDALASLLNLISGLRGDPVNEKTIEALERQARATREEMGRMATKIRDQEGEIRTLENRLAEALISENIEEREGSPFLFRNYPKTDVMLM